MTPFLSVYTPTYKRPTMLRLCEASVEQQTEYTEHIIVRDDVGIGIDGMFAAIPRHAHWVRGTYAMVLSDDDVLIDAAFAADLKREAAANAHPDVILFKGQIGEVVQPIAWGGEPELERINLSCFAVRGPTWRLHSADWGHRYEGDYDFIHRLWELGYRFHWWDRLAFRALRGPSRGAPE